MYICIKVKQHNQHNEDFIRSNTETQYIGFGEMEDLKELVKKDKDMWISAYKEYAESGWLLFDDYEDGIIRNYKGEKRIEVIIYYTNENSTRHCVQLKYTFIDQNSKGIYID